MNYQASSVGRLNRRLTGKLFGAVRTDSLVAGEHGSSLHDRLRIIYPSRTMALLAPNAARAADIHRVKPLPGSQGYEILRESLVDLELGSVLSHAKLIRVGWSTQHRNKWTVEGEDGAWLYAGSHNLSLAAWEKSYECGIVIPCKRGGHVVQEVVQVELQMDGPSYPVERMWDN
jgi:hypothetical protein